MTRRPPFLNLGSTRVLMAAVALAPGMTAIAQAVPTPALPTFDVVSVKLNKSGTNNFRSRYSPSGFDIENTPVLFIVRQAFDLFNANDDQITGLPEWAKTEHYDIQAKVAEDDIPAYKVLTSQQRGLMIQALLAERFKMAAHAVTRDAPIYALVVAKSGPKLHEANAANTYADGLPGPGGKGVGGAGMMRIGNTVKDGHTSFSMEGQAVPVAQLLGILTQSAGRTVVDKTGLTGKYDISLHWTSDDPSAASEGSATDAGPALFTALQEQLGLKLESQRGPVPGVIVEHIERPSEN